MKPSGARVYYYDLLAQRRQNPLVAIALDTTPIPEHRARHFLTRARSITRNLAADLKRAIEMLEDQPAQAERFLKDHPLLNAPRLTWEAEHINGIHEPLRARWQKLWKATWQQAEQEHLARLLTVLKPDQLLVALVARPSQSAEEGLAALRKRLEQDKRERPWVVPPVGVHLYEEPLDEWLLRPLLSGQLFFEVCRALAELTTMVPTLVQQRAAEQQAKSKRAAAQGRAEARQSGSRDVPPMPQGTATAEALFFYAVAAYRAGLPADAAGDDLILRDAQRLSPAQFRQLVALAVQVAEHLLWPDPLHSLPAQVDERQGLLRQRLLPRRLRREYENLSKKEQWRRAQAAPPPRWAAWETPLDATITLIDRCLAASIAPTEITSASLDTLLQLPRAILVEQYLYQATLGEWLRASLPKDLPNAASFLEYCRVVVEALGPWPQNAYGAPTTAEQAGQAVFWYAKLRLEALIIDIPGAAASNSPQAQSSRWLLWLASGSLPAKALELITVLAPLIARVIFQSVSEAASQGEPLLVARIKAGEPKSIAEVHRQLLHQAYAMGHQSISDAVREAWETLQGILDRLVLPSEVSLPLLAGDDKELAALDIPERLWYTKHRSDYQFIGGILKFSSSLVKPYTDKMVVITSDHADEEENPYEQVLEKDELETRETEGDILYEEHSALQVLALIGQVAQGRPKPPAPGALRPEDAQLLVRGMLNTHTGRALVGAFVHQRERAAVEIIRLWSKHWSLPESATQETIPWTETENRMYAVALARFLTSREVQDSPEMRRVVTDLFELPTKKSPKGPLILLLGMQERVAARLYDPNRRGEVLQVLQALEYVPPRQRQALCAQLLAQASVAHMLTLLEHEGWVRPPWLRVPMPGVVQDLQAQEENEWVNEEESMDSDPDEPSRAIFLMGRRRWLAELVSSDLTDQARALPFEFLGISFWSSSWQERLDGEPIASFYRSLMNALHPRLRAVMRAAWLTAYQQKLSNLPELVGLVGCLSSQLPAQLDHRPFFEAMQKCLSPKEDQDSEGSAGYAGNLSPTLRRLRQDLITARANTSAWFLALAGLVEDNERRLLFAAFSQAGNTIDRVGQWIEGQRPSQTEAQALLAELKRWHPRSAITEQNMFKILSAAAEHVRSIWRQLRSAPQDDT